jgi:hypothetical protein
MAGLRLIALVAVAACRQAAGAEPHAIAHSGVTPPAGWQPLPELATAVTTAAQSAGIVIDGSEAWGETAMGCYAVWLALSGGDAGAEALADQVFAGLTAENIVVKDVAKPTGETGKLQLVFERPPYHGRLRANLDRGRIAALACFANQREPVACDAACNTLLGGAP